LAAALRDARADTLVVYAHLDEQALRFPYLATVNPPLWELAHVAWFQEHWCLRWRDGAPRVPSLLADADRMLDSARIAHQPRWELPQLSWRLVHSYLERVLEATVQRIERDPSLDPYFPLLALYHEDMHAEALLMALQSLGLPGPVREPVELPGAVASTAQEVSFDGGRFEMGSRDGLDFVFDNERLAHEVALRPFVLAAATVTQAEYRAFVEAGGYEDPHWWAEAGWRWREGSGLSQPRHWQRDGQRWLIRRFGGIEALAGDSAMVHVSAYEAEAYAAFAGARLPTEAEWEYAARFGSGAYGDRYPWGVEPLEAGAANLDNRVGRPVTPCAFAAGDSRAGLRQLLGNVWEWTSSAFEAYPGFEPGPYREYSQPWFGDHRVLRGGSFATRSRLVHNRWRNFYKPDRNDVFAGIRLARSL
jgi:iron(II)-dependent oxidoreductase